MVAGFKIHFLQPVSYFSPSIQWLRREVAQELGLLSLTLCAQIHMH